VDKHQEIYQQIDLYVKGKLNASELAEFQTRLKNDPAFKELVEQEELIVKGIRSAAKADLKKELGAIHQQIKPADTDKKQPSKGTFNFLPYLIALILIGLLMAVLYMTNRNSTELPTKPKNEIPMAAAKPLWKEQIPVYDWSLSNNGQSLKEDSKLKEMNCLVFKNADTPTYSFDQKTLRLYLSAFNSNNLPILFSDESEWLLKLDGILYPISLTNGNTPLRPQQK